MATTYEWDLETYDATVPDGAGDVLDHDHRDKVSDFSNTDLRSALNGVVHDGIGVRLVLVRDHTYTYRNGPNAGSEGMSRQWAYVEDRKLPEEFDGGAKMPRRFKEEFAGMLVLQDTNKEVVK